jgi:hypothetical protein
MGLDYYDYEEKNNDLLPDEITYSPAYGAYSICSFITFGFSLFTVNL